MREDIKKRQMERKRKQEIKKRQNKFKLLFAGTVLSITLSAGIFGIFRNDNASADTAKLITTNTAEYKNEEKNKVEKQKKESGKISEFPIKYKKVISQAEVLEELSAYSRKLSELRSGQYVQYYGEKEGWDLISRGGVKGFVKSDKLEDLPENELKIIKGNLIATKKYIIPKEFETDFDQEAENALLVMLEASRREGLDIAVLRKMISKNEDDTEKTDSLVEEKVNTPNIESHTLRTGRAVEFNINNRISDIKFSKTPEGEWLMKNAHKYGFVLRYPAGKEKVTGYDANDGIYRYVGSENSEKMYKQNLTVEEYFK